MQKKLFQLFVCAVIALYIFCIKNVLTAQIRA